MATEWRIKGTELANCNCAYGCPCQFNALPTYGDCRAAVGYEIEEGHFGSVRLDGLRAVLLVSWPGPVHEGNGTMQVIVDERADAAQRDALVKIMTGAETDEMRQCGGSIRRCRQPSWNRCSGRSNMRLMSRRGVGASGCLVSSKQSLSPSRTR